MNRRHHLKTIAAGTLAAAGLPVPAYPAGAKTVGPTPTQTEGPYYPVVPIPLQADLTRRAGVDALGRAFEFHGVVSRGGTPLADAKVEIWQCDAGGRYRHPRDGGDDVDAGFEGFGAQMTDAQGRFRFQTLVPVAYQGRPPHIHLRVLLDGRSLLTTQAYPEDVGRGPVMLDRIARQSGNVDGLRFRLVEETGRLQGRFDVVLV